MNADDTITKMNQKYSRNGINDILVTSNGPQLATKKLQTISLLFYCFCHTHKIQFKKDEAMEPKEANKACK